MACRTSVRVNFSGLAASSQPPPFPGWDVTIPTLRSAASSRRTTTGFVFTLPAIYSDVRASPGLEARSVKTCSATVNRVLTFICNYYRYESFKSQEMGKATLRDCIAGRSSKYSGTCSLVRIRRADPVCGGFRAGEQGADPGPTKFARRLRYWCRRCRATWSRGSHPIA